MRLSGAAPSLTFEYNATNCTFAPADKRQRGWWEGEEINESLICGNALVMAVRAWRWIGSPFATHLSEAFRGVLGAGGVKVERWGRWEAPELQAQRWWWITYMLQPPRHTELTLRIDEPHLLSPFLPLPVILSLHHLLHFPSLDFGRLHPSIVLSSIAFQLLVLISFWSLHLYLTSTSVLIVTITVTNPIWLIYSFLLEKMQLIPLDYLKSPWLVSHMASEHKKKCLKCYIKFCGFYWTCLHRWCFWSKIMKPFKTIVNL